jgi:thiamine-phosphate pyrophosphorylase
MAASDSIYRVLDANLNRLREALRVIEEYYRFFKNDTQIVVTLKKLRHSVKEIELGVGRESLLKGRDSLSDCLADKNRPEELQRETVTDILAASCKRAQEASRVIEEYTKITDYPELSEKAKTIRFSLYNVEKLLFS